MAYLSGVPRGPLTQLTVLHRPHSGPKQSHEEGAVPLCFHVSKAAAEGLLSSVARMCKNRVQRNIQSLAPRPYWQNAERSYQMTWDRLQDTKNSSHKK